MAPKDPSHDGSQGPGVVLGRHVLQDGCRLFRMSLEVARQVGLGGREVSRDVVTMKGMEPTGPFGLTAT